VARVKPFSNRGCCPHGPAKTTEFVVDIATRLQHREIDEPAWLPGTANSHPEAVMEDNTIIKELSLPIYQSRGWMKLLGVMSIIGGALMVFTIVGIVICWLPIWLGVLLFKAGSAVEGAQLNGDKAKLVESLEKLKTYFVINGVLTLIGLIGGILAVIMTGGALFTLMDSYR
jgi:hypothetical protein